MSTTTQLPPVRIVDSSQPVYELQLAIWPTEVDDIIEAVSVKPHKPTSKPSKPSRPSKPVVAQPDDNDDDMLIQHDEPIDSESDESVEFDPALDLWPTIVDDEATEQDPVVTLVDYHKTYPNGTHESK